MADIERLREIQRRAEARLFAIPGVHTVGIAVKEVNGQPTGELAIKIILVRKRPAAEVPPGELIPAEIEGVKTDVVAAPQPVLWAGEPGARPDRVGPDDIEDEKYRPLIGGVVICAKGRVGGGSLGVFCEDANTNEILALTCLHNIVRYHPSNTPDMWMDVKVGQPTGKDSCCKSSSKIVGKVVDGELDLDVALVRLDRGLKYRREIQTFGRVANDIRVMSDQDRIDKTPLKKRGAVSRVTGGTVYMVGVTADLDDGFGIIHRVFDTVAVRSNPTASGKPGVFGGGGDSGAPVVDDANKVVGILLGGTGVVQLGGETLALGYVRPMDQIFEHFAHKLPVALRRDLFIAPAGQPEEVFPVPRSALDPDAEAAAARADDEAREPRDIEEDARRTRLGGWYADLYYRHRDEIEGLVNSNRHVATVWHRRGGAALMHAFGRVLRVPDARVPDTLDGIPLGDCVAGFSRALHRFGSEPLRRDLHAVTPTLPEVGGLCYDEIIDALARADRSPGSAHG